MSQLVIHSEAFASTGNMAAEGFRRLLGRPMLGVLQAALREALQNSIDAAKAGLSPSVLLRYRTLEPAQLEVLRSQIFHELPNSDVAAAPLRAVLSATSLRVLEICDSGTTGLGGPTSADVPPEGGEALNFVNFLRNVGSASDKHQGGGTYGYGKTSLYALSECSTIIVDTQTTFRSVPVRRFMACHLGSAYDAQVADRGARRFTGRHWWGCPGTDGVADPASAGDAFSLAQALGMPERDASHPGTSILILSPLLEQQSAPEVGQAIVETVLWYFWPRMVRSTQDERRLTVRVIVDGEEVLVPAPEDYPPLDLFAVALRQHHEQSERLENILSLKPKKLLGQFAVTHGLCAQRMFDTAREGALIPAQASHIALMRPVELVVRYIRGVPFSDERLEWAGVFICSREEEIEAAFADAEPPAHDDWIPDNLPSGHRRTYVRVAINRLNERAGSYAVVPQSACIGTPGKREQSIAAVSARMGRLLEHASDQEPGRRVRHANGRQGRRGPAISRAVFMRLELDEHQRPNAIFEAQLQNEEGLSGLVLIAKACLVADGAAIDAGDIPVHLLPEIVSLSLNEQRVAGPVMRLGPKGGIVQIRVRIPGQSAVGVQLDLHNGAES